MKGSKYLLLLATFMVGFGLVGVADAATVKSIAVTSPDSGAIKGIDSTFVVTAKVLDLSPVDSLEVIMYLTTSSDSIVVADNTNSAVAFGVLNQMTVINIARNRAILATPTTKLVDGQSGTTLSAANAAGFGSLVAVQQKRARGVASAASALGDADSVAVTISGDTTTFVWHGKVDASVGTVSNVRAAVFAIDSSNGGTSFTDTSNVSVSATSGQFNIDADRPAGPNKLGTAGGDGFIEIVANATDQSAVVSSQERDLLGIGDSLVVRSKLGTSIANDVILGDSLNVLLDVHAKNFVFDKSSRAVDTLRINITTVEGQFSDLNTSFPALTKSDTMGVFIVDAAGNRSGESVARLDGPAWGITSGVNFLFDTTKPALDSTNGDTILPVSTDTITDGTLSSGYPDVNRIEYKLAESLDSLYINFSGASALKLGIGNAATRSSTNPSLLGGAQRVVDFTLMGSSLAASNTENFQVAESDGANPKNFAGPQSGTAATVLTYSATDTLLKTGVHTITFQGKDLAGNLGPVLSRTNVYLDVDDITLVRLFPTKAAFGDAAATRVDTIEETTSQVVFKLSEPADSVLVTYAGLTGGDASVSRTRRLSGSQLTNTSAEQTLPIDGLVNGTSYKLTILARDLAGNFTRSDPDTFLYDTSFVVPVIKRFVVTASKSGLLAASHATAGDEITLTVQANAGTTGDRAAVTFASSVVLKVAGAGGVTLTGTGVTDAGGGRATLNADDWVTGSRTVTLKDTVGIDSLTVTVVDSTTTGGPFTGALDSTIVYNPKPFSTIAVTPPASAVAGEAFWVGVTLQDSYGNTRVIDTRFVSVSANKLGVELPQGSIRVTNGTGGFWAKSNYVGTGLIFDVVHALNDQTLAAANDAVLNGASDSLTVTATAVAALDGPNELGAGDYMGADGAGDQGGFIMLTWDLSSDHSTVDAYRIYREIQVNTRLATAADSVTTALVALSEPANEFVAWAKVDAVPGSTIGRAIVATLDNVATKWGIAAERNGETTAVAKEAFVSAEAIASPYALMAQTLMDSKEAAAIDVDAPVFAELLPEALSFVEQGVAPRLKSVDGNVMSSAITRTAEAVRAIDNIAPDAVPFVRANDTPGDAGSHISLVWTKSPSDQFVARSAGAVGPVASDMVAGVKGYNIYRKVGANGEYALIAKANSGETSFVDQTAFNGVRYTYQVTPYDDDNETTSELERTAMAIRNNVVDKNGKVVYGLFGMDNRVGFDDFFIFADNFGLSVADEAFEPAFDLAHSASPKIDFDDFFVFADNFGRGIEAAGKVVPMMAGLNADARLYLDAGAELPRIGEEVVIDVSLADFVELQAYGLNVQFDAEKLEFVKAVAENNLLGEGELAAPRVITKTDGEVAIAAYGDEMVSEGDLGLSLVFRTKTEIENTFVEVTASEVRDGNFAVNGISLPAPVQIQTRPEAFALANNYPNPFNPATTIKYALPEASNVTLEIYNVVGQVVRTLVADHQNAGRYVVQWDATNEGGHSLSSGIYFYRLQAGGEFLEVKKMLLLK
ncbi:T9SS type A sorting domain-containing protein [Candidatus Latescibacteria bacterium]|nr:T9SS type A sorting domain-containing protein [Candidatus Latescibacterota bacterium]